MKKLTFFSFVLIGKMIFSQVGINTTSPKSTFDIVAKTTDGSKSEGLIAPRLTGDQIKAGDNLYGTEQKGSIVYATSPVGIPSPKTISMNAEGYYFFDGNIWQKIMTANIYKDNGTLASNRTVDMADKTINFSSTATTGTSHFQVDGSTFNIDAVNNNIGIGVNAPSRKLDINSATVGAVKIVDGNQAEGRFLVSDADGVGTWKETTGSTTVVESSIGALGLPIASGADLTYTGAQATVTIPGYYIISPRMILNKTPLDCSYFVAYNLSTSSTSKQNPVFNLQDIHMSAGAGASDFIFTSNIAYMAAGTYYMMVRYGTNSAIPGGCTSYTTRTNNGQNAFSLILLK